MVKRDTTLIIPISVCYYWSYTVLKLFDENVIFYQAKSLMFYNIQTTYWTFLSENWTPK